MFGENFTTEGLDESSVCIGDRFRIGGAVVEVSHPRVPCYKLAVKFGRTDMPQRFHASGRCGFYLAVLEEGEVGAGDLWERLSREAAGMSVLHCYRSLFMHRSFEAEFILARPDNPKIPVESVDLVFVCNTYHHLEGRPTYFHNIKSSLKPGGRVAIIDFYHDERSGELGFPKRHLVSKEKAMEEMAEAGYRLAKEHTFLPKQYFLEFMGD